MVLCDKLESSLQQVDKQRTQLLDAQPVEALEPA